MEITKINNEPYSKERTKKIEEKNHSDPPSFEPTGDIVTICFNENVKRAEHAISHIFIPFQPNDTWVNNHTDYEGTPKWNWLKNKFVGRLDYVKAKQLDVFLSELGALGERGFTLEDLLMKQKIKIKKTKYRWLNSIKDKYGFQGGNINEHILELKPKFASFPEKYLNGFRIDPSSHVRVEKRIGTDGKQIYTASLDILVYRGFKEGPGVGHKIIQEIRASFV